MQTYTETGGAAVVVDDDYEREEDDEATGQALGGRHIEEEIPDEAMANYRRWRKALAAGEPEAVAVYEQIPHAEAEGVMLHMLADAMDGGDEEGLCRSIFGERYGDNVASVLRDDWMNDSEDFERAVRRIRGRLKAGCPTVSDRESVRRDALRRIRDVELLRLPMPWDTEEDGSVELRRRIVRGRRDYVCHQTGFPIPKGERHLAVTKTCEGKALTTRHSVAAAWMHVVMEDLSLCDALRPDEAPLA